ncbi:olfactory receptor 5P3-like [Macrotis lagotis]|uniref:olfactory receptor 5P3-like n=1 Tax=Macrotis lagotis TaxID=92651 RepID=UPI003D681461
MSDKNCTVVTQFIILGLTDEPTLCIILLLIFLGFYAVTLISNLSIITLIRKSSQLHTPMYLFLSHLAFVDIGYSSTVTPVMLKNFLVDKTIIPLGGCVTQLFFVVFFGTSEGFLLTVMAYDRYVAICNPLLYSVNMPPRICALLLLFSYLGACINAWIYTCCLLSLSFCGPNKINHFFCDYLPLLNLATYQDDIVEILTSASSGSIIALSVLIIIISYASILFSILKISSTEGRSKAFSTCTSHLTTVTLFYGTLTFIYVMPNSNYSADENKVISVFYMVIIPLLNPLIYSLRNNEVKGALRKLMRRKPTFS